MLKSPFLFSAGVFVTLLSWTGVAKAKDDLVGLSFELPPTKAVMTTPTIETLSKRAIAQPNTAEVATDISIQEVQLIKPQETLPPLNNSNQKESVAIAAESVDIGVHFLESTVQLPSTPAAEQATSVVDNNPLQALSFGSDLLERYSAGLKQSGEVPASATEFSSLEGEYGSLGLDDWIFEGGSRSLVAHTVGSAEGTRRWDGNKTQAYYGHKDPGNGVWNLGTFSYQHEADTPEEADAKQIKRLKSQGFQLEDQATRHGMTLSLVEKLNGLDLANQAPLAALGKGGYIERLAQAHRLQMKGEEAIAWARTRAYIDPNTKAWNAPGLGNTLYSITKDQERRISAIDKALRAYDRTGGESLALADLKSVSLESSGLENTAFDVAMVESPSDGFQMSDLARAVPVEEVAIAPQYAADLEQLPVSFVLPAAIASDVHLEPAPKPVEETKPLEQSDDPMEAAEAVETADESPSIAEQLPEKVEKREQKAGEPAAKLSWLRIENRVIDRK